MGTKCSVVINILCRTTTDFVPMWFIKLIYILLLLNLCMRIPTLIPHSAFFLGGFLWFITIDLRKKSPALGGALVFTVRFSTKEFSFNKDMVSSLKMCACDKYAS